MARLGMFEPATLFKTPTACRSCGYKALYWQKDGGHWKLHHWSVAQEGGKPRFILHRCGFDSWGRPKPASLRATRKDR